MKYTKEQVEAARAMANGIGGEMEKLVIGHILSLGAEFGHLPDAEFNAVMLEIAAGKR